MSNQGMDVGQGIVSGKKEEEKKMDNIEVDDLQNRLNNLN